MAGAFSVPNEGPLTDFESWRPDFMGDQKGHQRDVVRHGVVSIPVSFSITAKWLKKLAGYAKLDKISEQYFDVEMA